jgi:hypothetical protein
MGDTDQISLKLGELSGTVKALVDNTNLRFAERNEASKAQYLETGQRMEAMSKSIDKLATTVGNLKVAHAKQAVGFGTTSAIGVLLAKYLLGKSGVHF